MLHLHSEVLGSTSRPDIKRFLSCLLSLDLCISVCTPACARNFSWYPVVCLASRLIGPVSRNEKHERKSHVNVMFYCINIPFERGEARGVMVRHSFHSWLSSLSQQCPGNSPISQALCQIRKMKQPSINFPPDSSNSHFFRKLSSYMRSLQTIKPSNLDPHLWRKPVSPQFHSLCSSSLCFIKMKSEGCALIMFE